MKKRILKAVLALCLLLTLLPTAAMAASNEISTFSDLEAAFSNGGTYTLTQDITVTKQLTLDSGKTLTINGGGHILAPEVTGLNAQGIVNDDASVITNIISNNGTLTLSNLTIYGGKGRCVYNDGSLTMTSVSLERAHSSSAGAGLYNDGGNAILTNCNIRRNGCASSGGGFMNAYSSTLILENCSIVENRNFNSSTGGGAGENKTSDLYMNNCTVANNQSSEIGGGINNYNATLYIMNSTFTGNVTTQSNAGGAIGHHGGSVYAVNSVFAFNYAGSVQNDIGYDGDGISLYNCAYGVVSENANEFSATNCKTLTGTPADIFNGSRTSGILDKDGNETSTTFARPVITKNGSVYGVYPKTGDDSALLSGGIATKYDRDGFTVKMSYGDTALGSLAAATTAVDEYQDGSARAAGVIGALPASTAVATVYTVTVKAATGGTVTGGSAQGDSHPAGWSGSITATADTGYTFAGWLVGDETTPSSTENPYEIANLRRDISLTPVFTASPVSPVYYDVTVSVNNSSYGNAAADPSSTTSGNTVILTATANTGYEFTGWDVIGGGVTLADATSATTTFTMGDSAVSVKANFAPLPTSTHTVSFASNGGSAVGAETVEHGSAVVKPTDPTRSGYTFLGWYLDGATSAYDFSAAVTGDITLTAQWKLNTYTVSFESNGGSSVGTETVEHGSAVAKPADPTRSGYRFCGWYADAGFTTAYDFATPITADITLYAKWQENSPAIHTCESKCEICGGCKDAACKKQFCKNKCLLLSMNFADVDANKYYTDAVEYVYHRGIMGGYSATTFNPAGSVTRQQVWMVLARMSGNDPANMTEARAWAIEVGVSDGSNPTASVTRQQFVAMLWRYAKDQGYDVSVGESTNILSYNDAFSVSEYAVPAMQWACGEGLVQGTDGNLNPRSGITRAQMAAILMRFCENVVNG